MGAKGEFTVNLLYKKRDDLVNDNLCLGEDAKTLATQTEEWLNEIFNGAKVEVPSSESCVGSGRISVLFSFVDVSSTSSSPKSTSSSSPNSITSKPFLGLSTVLSTSCSVICLASASLEASRSPCLATSAKLEIV